MDKNHFKFCFSNNEIILCFVSSENIPQLKSDIGVLEEFSRHLFLEVGVLNQLKRGGGLYIGVLEEFCRHLYLRSTST